MYIQFRCAPVVPTFVLLIQYLKCYLEYIEYALIQNSLIRSDTLSMICSDFSLHFNQIFMKSLFHRKITIASFHRIKFIALGLSPNVNNLCINTDGNFHEALLKIQAADNYCYFLLNIALCLICNSRTPMRRLASLFKRLRQSNNRIIYVQIR